MVPCKVFACFAFRLLEMLLDCVFQSVISTAYCQAGFELSKTLNFLWILRLISEKLFSPGWNVFPISVGYLLDREVELS